MNEIVFLLEERSAEELIKGIMASLLPHQVSFRCVTFEGKQDLERNLTRKIKYYRAPGTKFIILRDQDSGDCRVIKADLVERCRQAGREDVLVRIACRELESWYLADLKAVEKGLGIRNLAQRQGKEKYRSPDRLESPSRLLVEIASNYQKISGSRAISPYLDMENQRSASFAVFIAGIRKIISELNSEYTSVEPPS